MNLRQLLYPQLHYAKNCMKKQLNTYVMFYDPGKGALPFLSDSRHGRAKIFASLIISAVSSG